LKHPTFNEKRRLERGKEKGGTPTERPKPLPKLTGSLDTTEMREATANQEA